MRGDDPSAALEGAALERWADLHRAELAKAQHMSVADRAADWIAQATEDRESHGLTPLTFPPALRGSRWRPAPLLTLAPAMATAVPCDDPEPGTAPRVRAVLPAVAHVERPIRRACYSLRYYLRAISRPRIATCGHTIIAEGGRVAVVISDEGRASFVGVATCGSVWECPACALVIKATRAGEVRSVVEQHGIDRVAMLTLTIRHGAGDDLQALRAGLANAWRGTTRGAPWARAMSALGIVGSIRALELTHGSNGWHPHLHVLLLLDAPIAASDVYAIDGADRWVPRRWHGWIADRWADMVARHVGAEHTPSDDRGVNLVPASVADYVSKLGLELSDPGTKTARSANGRTPLQIAADYTAAERAVRAGRHYHRAERDRDAALWIGYCDAMRGARALTWSRGLKRRYGVDERTDLECAFDEDPPDKTARMVGTIDCATWHHLRRIDVAGTPATYGLLIGAERGGGPGLARAIRAARALWPLNARAP